MSPPAYPTLTLMTDAPCQARCPVSIIVSWLPTTPAPDVPIHARSPETNAAECGRERQSFPPPPPPCRSPLWPDKSGHPPDISRTKAANGRTNQDRTPAAFTLKCPQMSAFVRLSGPSDTPGPVGPSTLPLDRPKPSPATTPTIPVCTFGPACHNLCNSSQLLLTSVVRSPIECDN